MAGMDRQNPFLILDAAARAIVLHDGMAVAGFGFVGVKILIGEPSNFDMLPWARVRRGLGAGRDLNAGRGVSMVAPGFWKIQLLIGAGDP